MAGKNEVIIEFIGEDGKLKKATSSAKESIDEVKKSSDQADDSLKKTGDSGSTSGDKISKGFKVGAAAIVAVGAASAAAVGKLAKDAVAAYADYEQLSGGVAKLFAKDGATVMEYANDAYKTAGLSANQYMESVTGFSASLISGVGGDTAKAAQLANVAISDMSDNANTYGTDMDSIQRTYQGFAKSQFGMLDNLKLGYGGSASEMARLINDSGVLGDTMVDAASVSTVSMDKIIEAIHQTQTTMGIAGTTAKEAASTISGSLASTKAAWTNTLAMLATGDNASIEKALNGLLESAGNFVANISKILPAVLSGVTGLITGLIKEIPGIMELILPALITGVVDVIDGLVDAIPDILKVLTKIIPDLVDGLVKVFLSLVDALPEIIDGFIQLFNALAVALLDPKVITQVVQALLKAALSLIDVFVKSIKNPTALNAVLQGAITLFMEIVKALPDIIIALVKALPDLIKSLVSFLTKPDNLQMIIEAMLTLGKELVKAIPEIIMAILTALGDLIPGIKNLFSGAGDKIKEVWNSIVDWFKGLPDKLLKALSGIGDGIKNIFDGAVDGIKEGFKSGLNWVIKQINKLVKAANKVIGWIPGVDMKIPEVPELASGGYVNYAGGGSIRGAGSGTSDSIPAMVSNGEFVLKASAVRRLGLDNVTAMNEGKSTGRDAPIVGEMHVKEEADALAIAQQIGALVRWA